MEKIIQINEEQIKNQLGELVRGTVEKTLNSLLDKEADELCRKVKLVVSRLRELKLPEAALRVEMGIEETLVYMCFPREHWVRIRTNNTLERLNREIKRRTRVVGSFPDGHSALMLVCARLRYVASQEWGSKRYLVGPEKVV